MNIAPSIFPRYFDANGNPLAGGKIYTYQAGTTTPQATYTDSTGGTPNANPVILDANGEASIWLSTDLSYKFVLKDSTDVTMKTVDNVVGLIITDSVGTASIQSEAVTTAKIADGAVTSAKLAAAVAGSGLAGGAGTALSVNVDNSTLEVSSDTVRVKDGGLSTAKYAALSVTAAKQAVATSTTSSGTGLLVSTTSATYVDMTNMSVSITVAGNRPVWVGLIWDSAQTDPARVSATDGANIQILRDATVIARFDFIATTTFSVPPTVVQAWDMAPGAGTYTYKVQWKKTGATNASLNALKLLAFEI